uniref:HAT C-terminal dimerisation domain-containing protein n=1 Tax=Mycena chlorophos TaxID=658473 RepID=A0ABQ0KWQ8_MYCCL|nr:predicted protein [Mycena chlorophos]
MFSQLFSLMMDNAANCNTTATELQKLNPKFDAKKRRGRCTLHSIQLGAKMFLSFFSKEPARKARKVKVTAADGQVEEVTLKGITGDDGDAELNRLLDENAAADEADLQQAADAAARQIHDLAAIKNLRQRAIREMDLKGVTVSASDTKLAIQLLPRVSKSLPASARHSSAICGQVAGLSRRIHDSSPIKHAFGLYVSADATIQGQTTTIARRCASRWDSNHDMLATLLILEQPARKLLNDKAFNLKAYKLAEKQWSLGREVCDLLECFQLVTQRFSRRDSSRALVCEVIPAIEELRRRMHNASEMDGTQTDEEGVAIPALPDICRVAAYAASLVLDQYLLLMQECEIYEFAIALRPDLKLNYFRKNGRSEADIKRIHDGLVERFKDFKPASDPVSATAPPSTQPAPRRSGGSRFDTKPRSTTPSVPTQTPDDIRSYLASPIVDLGGRTVLEYWHSERRMQPHLAEMGLAFCSAPATSVDMERAFSEGRNMCAWNQRSMSSQTFREQISVAAWYDAPFFDMGIAEQIIREKSRPLRGPEDA